MAEEDFDPFDLPSGFADDVDVAFKVATFGFRSDFSQYGNPLLLIIDSIVDGEDGPTEQEQIFSCGKGWELEPGSKTQARREDGKKKSFIKTSAVGLLITHAASAMEEAGKSIRDLALDPTGPLNASMWDGTIWHMKQIETNYGGDIGKKTRLLPVEYKGRAGEPKATETAATVSVATNPAPANNGKLTAATKVKVRKLNETYQLESKPYEEFLEAGLALVEGSAEGEDYVMADDFAY